MGETPMLHRDAALLSTGVPPATTALDILGKMPCCMERVLRAGESRIRFVMGENQLGHSVEQSHEMYGPDTTKASP